MGDRPWCSFCGLHAPNPHLEWRNVNGLIWEHNCYAYAVAHGELPRWWRSGPDGTVRPGGDDGPRSH